MLECVGCGLHDPERCYPVRGSIRVDDKPLAEATVIFHPIGVGEAKLKQKPFGRTDEEGRFQLSTSGEHDGAPPGRYAVTIEYRELRAVGEETIRDGPSLLPPRFSDPAQTVLQSEVIAGENDIPPFQVEWK